MHKCVRCSSSSCTQIGLFLQLFDTESSRKIKPNVTVPVLEPEVARLRKMVVRTNAGVGSEVDVEDSGIDYVSSLWTF